MTSAIGRRAFFGVVASGLAAPRAARAQRAPTIPRIGALFPAAPAAAAPNVEAFKQGLRDLGHAEGRTYVFELRGAADSPDGLSRLAQELVALKVDVIVASTDLAVIAARQHTSTIPIVMTGATDPVGTGFVASLRQPGGNVTGLSRSSPELSGKRLELLRELMPRLGRVAFVWNPAVLGAPLDYRETEQAAHALRLTLLSVGVAATEDVERAFAAVKEQHAQALIVQAPNPILYSDPARIVGFASANRLPAMYANRAFVDAGGLMSYGASVLDLHRRSAAYVDKILKGARPADLPVERPSEFELIINRKAAKAIKLTLPPSILQRATKVIE